MSNSSGPTTEFDDQTNCTGADLIDHVKHELFLVSFVVNDVDDLLMKQMTLFIEV